MLGLDLKEFTVNDQKYWDWVLNSIINHDSLKEKSASGELWFAKSYYIAIANFASRVAYLAERMLDYGYMKKIDEIINYARKYAFYDMIDDYEVSNNQADIAISYLKNCWKYGYRIK